MTSKNRKVEMENILKQITPEKLDSMTMEQRLRIQEIVAELKERKLNYPILDFELLPHQKEIIDALAKRNPNWTPYYKYVIMMGWNGAGKTIVGWYAMACKMLWSRATDFWLPFLWKVKTAKVVTATGTQLKENIEPYILWTWTDEDLLKIPPSELKWKPKREKDVLKEFTMKNWAKLFTWTYDQGMTRLQGGTPDYLWLDEIPERWADFDELTKRTRNEYWQFLITFTPTNYNKKIYDWIHKKPTEEETKLYWEGRRFFIQVDALKNTKANHSHMIGKSEDDLQIVRFWKFVPPTGLVYKEFRRDRNVIQHFHPKEMVWEVKYYWALDFGVNHPMAFLFIAVDSDWQVYVFDIIYKKNLLLKDLKALVEEKKKEYWIEFEWIVADSADKRARLELKEIWMKTISADKRSKGESQMSNRRTGIMKINQMLNLWEIVVSDRCQELIEEFDTHHYSENWVDWTVKKTEDDALDALRYFIFNYRVKSELAELKRQAKKLKRRKAWLRR